MRSSYPNIITQEQSPLYIDFLSKQSYYRRYRGGRQLLVKAIKLKRHPSPVVLDATAGLGQDAFVMACLGYRVQLCERSPLIASLLQDAIKRLKEVEPHIDMSFVGTEAKTYLAGLTQEACPDIIYLDPMFPERTKSALVKKEMRLLRTLVGDDADALELFTLARERARYKVVVKRPRHAPELGGKPSLVLWGRSGRFDVYLNI